MCPAYGRVVPFPNKGRRRIAQWEPHLSAAAAPTPLQKIQSPPSSPLPVPTPTRGRASSSRLVSSPRPGYTSSAPRRDANPRTRNSRGGRRYSRFPHISHRFPTNLTSPLPPPPGCAIPCSFFSPEIFLVLFWLFLSGARGLGGFAAAGLAFWLLGEGWWSAVCAV